jgi:hypothetical protein
VAVTPGEAAKINDAAEAKAIEDMEAHIDGCLNKSFRTGMFVSISDKEILLSAEGGWTKRAWEEVKRRFEDAGWQVKKKRNRERYGGSDSWIFSATPEIPTASVVTTKTRNNWYDADNEGKPSECQR